MAEVEKYGPEALHARLELVDPLAASRIHPHDTKRLVRALEVFHATGLPISHRQRHFDEPPEQPPQHVFALQWPRERLHERINGFFQRLQTQFRQVLRESRMRQDVVLRVPPEPGAEMLVTYVEGRMHQWLRSRFTTSPLSAWEHHWPMLDQGLFQFEVEA
jgi:hypothetical protein